MGFSVLLGYRLTVRRSGLLCPNYLERISRRLSPRELERWDLCPWEAEVVVVLPLQVGPPQLPMLPLLPRKRRKKNLKRRKMMTWDSDSSTRFFNSSRRLLFVTSLLPSRNIQLQQS